jgi:hypothetical protein
MIALKPHRRLVERLAWITNISAKEESRSLEFNRIRGSARSGSGLGGCVHCATVDEHSVIGYKPPVRY